MARFQPWCLAALPLLAAFAQAPAAPDVSTRAVVAAAGAYVRDYQQQLTAVVADETYTQDIRTQIPLDANMPRTRLMEGEVFFMFAPEGGWMAIRDVVRVDRRKTETRLDVLQVLRTQAVHQVAQTLKSHNSQFNIGRMFRNFNEPTLGLLVLDAEHRARFSFDRRRVERTSGGTAVVLAFRERERPTLIRDLKRGSVFSRGELRIEAGTGRILRTVLTASIDRIRLELTTEYQADERLGMWVPVRFRERYEYGTRQNRLEAASEYEEIVCEATYSNYRRFETQVRIK